MAQFSEEAVHGYLFKTGLADLIDETVALPAGGRVELTTGFRQRLELAERPG